jgi:probable HAF family extracellular repeat protein
MQDLGSLGGDFSFGSAINNQGQVAGTSTRANFGAGHAFRWTKSGGMLDLGTLPGRTFSEATAINDLGQVASEASTATQLHAFLWTS